MQSQLCTEVVPASASEVVDSSYYLVSNSTNILSKDNSTEDEAVEQQRAELKHVNAIGERKDASSGEGHHCGRCGFRLIRNEDIIGYTLISTVETFQ